MPRSHPPCCPYIFFLACAAHRVLAFLRAKAEDNGRPYSAQQEEAYTRQVDWLNSCGKQLGRVRHKARPDKMQWQAAGQWADAPQVVEMVEQLKERALQAVSVLPGGQAAFYEPHPTWETVQVARKLHDALLAAFNFGHFPPIRPSCLITMQHPSISDPEAQCWEAGCTVGGCLGNRMVKSGGRYQAHFPHHKTSNR